MIINPQVLAKLLSEFLYKNMVEGDSAEDIEKLIKIYLNVNSG